MKIYIAHSRVFNFRDDLYVPLQEALSQHHELILPHVETDAPYPSQKLFTNRACDLVIAEVSYPSTGLGIELGWASAAGIPIYAVHLATAKISDSINAVATRIAAYQSNRDLIVVGRGLVAGIARLGHSCVAE